MKDTHESQKDMSNSEPEIVYSPIEDLQKIEGGTYNQDSFDLGKQPKSIRYVGYSIVGFFSVIILLAIIFSFFE